MDSNFTEAEPEMKKPAYTKDHYDAKPNFYPKPNFLIASCSQQPLHALEHAPTEQL